MVPRGQAGAWEAISHGRHALVIAPTGSGKTLASFLWAIDRLATREPKPDDRPGTRVLYISPLKALGVDVERNLRAPLVGVTQTARRLGAEPPHVSVGVRSGDTTSADRRALVASPPDILITTPESLFLMLTSQARETLATVETVIVDEVHAVAATWSASTPCCRRPPSASGCPRRCGRRRRSRVSSAAVHRWRSWPRPRASASTSASSCRSKT